MQLENLLSVLDENKNIYIEDACGDLLATYDGRNAIPEHMNSMTVCKVWLMPNGFLVTVE